MGYCRTCVGGGGRTLSWMGKGGGGVGLVDGVL